MIANKHNSIYQAQIPSRANPDAIAARHMLRQSRAKVYPSGSWWGWVGRVPGTVKPPAEFEDQTVNLSEEVKLPEDTQYSVYADGYGDIWKAIRRKEGQSHSVGFVA